MQLEKWIYTPENDVRSEIETIVKLFELGADGLFLRKPTKPIEYWYAYIEQFPYGWESKMMTTDYRLLSELNLGGFHFQRDILKDLTRKDLLENLQMLKSSNKISSVTVHNVDELTRYDSYFDLLLISPLMDSISKKGYKSTWDLNKLKELVTSRKDKTSKWIAQGGISNENISTIKDMGLEGYTLLGYLWENPSEAIENFKKII